jgi:hypothetical protein
MKVSQSIKKFVCVVLSCLQIMTPELVSATAVQEDVNTVDPKHFYQMSCKIQQPNNEKVVAAINCYAVQADRDGNFHLNFDPKLFKNQYEIVLTHNDRAIGTLSYTKNVLQLIGFTGSNFIIQNTQHDTSILPSKFLAQTQGTLTLKDGSFAELAWLQALKINLDGQIKSGKALIVQAIEECTIQGDINTPVSVIKSKSLSHQGKISGENIYFEIEKGVDGPQSRIQSSQDILINGFQEYQHHGSFAAKRSVITQGQTYLNTQGSKTFAGLLQQFKGDTFQDNGNSQAWQRHVEARKVLLDQHCLFNGHYFISETNHPISSVEIQEGASINVALGARIQCAQRLNHRGSIAIRPDLFELPLAEYSAVPLSADDLSLLENEIGSARQAYMPQFQPFSGVQMLTNGFFDFGSSGRVDASTSSVHYSADQFSFAGHSQSGFLKEDYTNVSANRIFATGEFTAPNKLQFDVGQELLLGGQVNSSLTTICGGHSWLQGSVTGSLAIAQSDEVTCEGQQKGHFFSVQAKRFSSTTDANLNLTELTTISAEKANIRGNITTKQMVVDAVTKDIGGKITTSEKTILTGGTTHAHGHLQTHDLLVEEDSLDLTGHTSAKQAHLKLKDRLQISGENNIDTLLGEAEKTIVHTGNTQTSKVEFKAASKKISGTLLATDFARFSGGSTESDANLNTKKLSADEKSFRLQGLAKAEVAQFSNLDELMFGGSVSIGILLADVKTFNQNAHYNGDNAVIRAQQGNFTAPTTLTQSIQGAIQALRISDQVQAGDDIFLKGNTVLEEQGVLKAANSVQLEGHSHRLLGSVAGKVASINSANVSALQYSATAFKNVGDLRLLFEKGGTFSADLHCPALLFLKCPEAIVIDSQLKLPVLEADTPHLTIRSLQPLDLSFVVRTLGELSLEAPAIKAFKPLQANILTIKSPGAINLLEACMGRQKISINVGGNFSYTHLGLWTQGLLEITTSQPVLQLANTLTLPGKVKAQAPSIHVHANKEVLTQNGCEFTATQQTYVNGRVVSEGEIQFIGKVCLPQNASIKTNKSVKIDGPAHQLHGSLQSPSARIRCPSIANLSFLNSAFKDLGQLNLVFSRDGIFSNSIDIPGFLEIELETPQTLTNRARFKANQGIRFKIPGSTLINLKAVVHTAEGYKAHPGGELLTSGLLEIHGANFHNLLGHVEAGQAWTNLTSQFYSNGRLVIHGTHVNDSRITKIERAQRCWKEQKPYVYEIKNKKQKTSVRTTQTVECAESFPLHLSGLHQAQALATQHTAALTKLFPKRPNSSPLLAQEYHLIQGAHLVTGEGGTNLFTSRLILTGPNVEVRTVPLEIRQKNLTEIGMREVKTINPACIESKGSINLNSNVIRMQATDVRSSAPSPKISVQAQRLEFPDFKVKHTDEPFIHKVKNVTYLVRGWHEEGMQTIFMASGGSVKLGQKNGSIEGVCPLIDSTVHEILSPNVNLHHQILDHGQDCEVIDVKVNKKRANLATLASFVTGVILTASGIGSAAGALLFAKGSVAAAMSQATVVGLGSQFSAAMVNCDGNIKRATSSLTTAASLRGAAVNILSAGILNKMSTYFNWSSQPETFSDYTYRGIGQSVISGTLNTTIGRQDPITAWQSAFTSGAVNSCSAWGTNVTGKLYNTDQPINYFEHKLLHFVVGAFSGAASQPDRLRGAFVGGASAAFAETLVELLPDIQNLMPGSTRQASDFETTIHHRADLSCVMTATAAFFANQDVGTASNAAFNAVQNNFVISMLKKGSTALASEFPDFKELRQVDEYVQNSPVFPLLESLEMRFAPWGLFERELTHFLNTPQGQWLVDYALTDIPALAASKNNLRQINAMMTEQHRETLASIPFYCDDNPIAHFGGGAMFIEFFHPTSPLDIALTAVPGVAKAGKFAATAAKSAPRAASSAASATKQAAIVEKPFSATAPKEAANQNKSRLFVKKPGDASTSKPYRPLYTPKNIPKLSKQEPIKVEPVKFKPDISTFTPGTRALLGGHNKYKANLFERANEPKSASALRGALTEQNGGQTEKAIKRGVIRDHTTKVNNEKKGLKKRILFIKESLGYPYLPQAERDALREELSHASKLLDYAKKFVKDTKKETK